MMQPQQFFFQQIFPKKVKRPERAAYSAADSKEKVRVQKLFFNRFSRDSCIFSPKAPPKKLVQSHNPRLRNHFSPCFRPS